MNHEISAPSKWLKGKMTVIESMREELTELHSFIKRVEKKGSQMFKEFKSNYNGVGAADQGLIEDKIE